MWVTILTYFFSAAFHTLKYDTLSCKSFVVAAFKAAPFSDLLDTFMDISSYLYLVAKYKGLMRSRPTWRDMAWSSPKMASWFMTRLYTIKMKARRLSFFFMVLRLASTRWARTSDEENLCTWSNS